MADCYWCDAPLTSENISKEHIIPQALGGKLMSPNLLCKACNNDLGKTIDARFNDELDYIAISLNLNTRNIKKRRVEMYNKNGEVKNFGPGLEALSYITFNDGNQEVTIPNIPDKDLEKHARKKIKELELKGKGIYKLIRKDLPRSLTTYYFNVKGFGSADFHKGFLKMAINFAFLNNIEIVYLKHAINVLKGNIIDYKITRFCYLDSFSIPVINDEIFHFLFVRGDFKNRLLYCYIELFSTHKMLIFLNSEYKGEDIEEQYCWDVINNRVANKKISKILSRNHYEDYQTLRFANSETTHDILNKRLLKILEQRIKS